MANDYIPRGDAEFHGWQANFVSQANANLAGLGLVAADLTPIQTAQGAWATSYTNHVTLQAIAQSTRQTKDDNRASLESLIRALVRRLQASPDVSDPTWLNRRIGPGEPNGPWQTVDGAAFPSARAPQPSRIGVTL